MKILTVGLLAAALAARVEAAPKIVFDKDVFDFGVTTQVASVTGTFTFQNAGDSELKLSKPAPSCGCTVASVKPDTLKPGEKGELVFTVNVGSGHGPMQKSISVPSNDPTDGNKKLTIKLDVRQTYEITPAFISLGDVRIGATTNVTVNVKRLDGKKLALAKTVVTGEMTKARIEPIEGSTEQGARIVVEAEAKGTPRRFNESVQVFSEDGGPAPAFVIQVHGRLVGDIALDRERLVWAIGNVDRLPASRMEGVLVRRLRITSTSQPPKPLEVKNATTSIPDLVVNVETVETNKSYEIVAKFPEVPKQSAQGTITVQTNLESQPTVVVPVVVNVINR